MREKRVRDKYTKREEGHSRTVRTVATERNRQTERKMRREGILCACTYVCVYECVYAEVIVVTCHESSNRAIDQRLDSDMRGSEAGALRAPMVR